VGKTHLLAAAFHSAPQSKLYASFDELVAAAGPLGMKQLTALVSEPALVCIDEIILEDPGNIVMLLTLLQHMADSGTHVLATANVPPQEASDGGGWVRTFEREIGVIASMFETVRIEGPDRRRDSTVALAPVMTDDRQTLRASWTEIADYLTSTHPMHDAAWLDQIDILAIDGPVNAPSDEDEALRFVRFIDRVYDRGVELRLPPDAPPPEMLVAPLIGDRRYIWHVARGMSRLTSMLDSGASTLLLLK
jgi:cell division protein ZapE